MKRRGTVSALLFGTVAAYLLYLILQFLLAAFAVRTPISVKYLVVVQQLLCFVSVFAGSRFTARNASKLGSMVSSLIVTGFFVLLVFLSGFLLYNRIGAAGEGIRFLLAALSGGVLAGIPTKKKKRATKRRKQ